MKNKPIHTIRFGSIKAAIWENQTKNGKRYSVTFSRIYKEGNEWKNTETFGRDDLLTVAKCADEAHGWIFEQGAKEDEK